MPIDDSRPDSSTCLAPNSRTSTYGSGVIITSPGTGRSPIAVGNRYVPSVQSVQSSSTSRPSVQSSSTIRSSGWSSMNSSNRNSGSYSGSYISGTPSGYSDSYRLGTISNYRVSVNEKPGGNVVVVHHSLPNTATEEPTSSDYSRSSSVCDTSSSASGSR